MTCKYATHLILGVENCEDEVPFRLLTTVVEQNIVYSPQQKAKKLQIFGVIDSCANDHFKLHKE